MKNRRINDLTLTAMLFALGIVLPFLFGQIPQIGSMLLPMHIPVFLCSFICGGRYAAPMAIALPLFRSLVFSRPNLYPEAISIAAEMAVYALVSAVIYRAFKKKATAAVYFSLIPSMIAGRVVRGVLTAVLLSISGKGFAIKAFVSGVVISGIPGIILQLVIIPITMAFILKTGVLNTRNHEIKE